MKYIKTENSNDIDYNSYLEYLSLNKHNFDPRIYDFASNYIYFNLDSPSSLHDSWLESFIIKEVRGADGIDSKMEAEVTLLGAFHDRKIHMRYEEVSGYEFIFDGSACNRAVIRSNHGDLVTHEIRLKNNIYEHEIEFSDGHKFLIVFSKFEHWEELI